MYRNVYLFAAAILLGIESHMGRKSWVISLLNTACLGNMCQWNEQQRVLHVKKFAAFSTKLLFLLLTLILWIGWLKSEQIRHILNEKKTVQLHYGRTKYCGSSSSCCGKDFILQTVFFAGQPTGFSGTIVTSREIPCVFNGAEVRLQLFNPPSYSALFQP